MQQIKKDSEDELLELLNSSHQELARYWLGKDFIIELLLASVVAKGHILVVDIPGVGKTTLAKNLAKILGLDFNRIQFTNDILPSDILGGNIYNPLEGKFSFAPGAIFTDFLLADEINRAPTRSQSAFLQAMEEGHVAIDGVNHPLSSLFTVIATQNPIDFDSTNPLPEAQLDRFLTTVSLGYPTLDDEFHLLNDYSKTIRNEPVPIMTKHGVEQLRAACSEVFLHPDLSRYIVEMARATREDEQTKLGISPRGSMHLAAMAKAYALVKGRRQVIPEDIQCLVHPVWDHRLLPRHGRDYDSSHAHEIIETVLKNVPVPR